MVATISPLPNKGTFPDLLLNLTALSGEFPISQISRLPGSESYKESSVKKLKKDKLLRTYYRDGLRGLRLTAPAKRLLLNDLPDYFLPLLSGETSTNAPKYTIPHRLRLHRMAEVFITMMNADILVFPWERANIFSASSPKATLNQPSYFTSKEVKEIGAQAAKIRGSRSTGVLLTDETIYVIYNTASSEMKWEYKAEMRLKALLQIELCQRILPSQFRNAEQNAIVFGTDMEQLEVLMGINSRLNRNYFVLDGNFEHFYYLTNNHHGEVLLKLFCEAELRELLDQILMENLSASRPGWPVDHDAFDETESPVLFGYTCDMPRIKRFDTALSLHGLTGTLICFDFQEDVLRRVCGPQVTLQSIDFEAFERSVLHIPQTTD